MSDDAVPLLDLHAQYATIKGEITAAIDRVMSSQRFILGPEAEALEGEVARYCHCEHAIAVSSGTDALLLSLMAMNVGTGDEVVTTPYTFVATATSIARLGARAIFVDIDETTFNINPSKIEAALSPRTRCILPVHLFGQMAPMPEIRRIAQKHGVQVLEDGAQAIGATRDGEHLGHGTIGATLSFFPSKNLGAAGDAGMIVTNDRAFAERVRLMRNQGQAPKYNSVVLGGNFRMDDLQAAVLRAKLPHLDGWTSRRIANAAHYRELFAKSEQSVRDHVVLPTEVPGCRHAYNQFVIRAGSRDALKAHLARAKIGSEIYYPSPMHLQPCFAAWGGAAGQFPKAESACESTLALPIFPELTPPQRQRVLAVITDFYAGRRG